MIAIFYESVFYTRLSYVPLGSLAFLALVSSHEEGL